MSNTCEKCSKQFKYAYLLDRHRDRKTPCDKPVMRTYKCEKCGNSYRHSSGLSAHKNVCTATGEAVIDNVKLHIPEQKGIVIQTTGNNNTISNAVSNVSNVVSTVNQVNHIYITPWENNNRCISIDAGDIKEAFARNSRLREYARMNDADKSNSNKAPTYVAELMMELIKIKHEDPTARNIYLNPARTNQVLVLMKNGTWDIKPLDEAIELLLSGVAIRLLELSIHDKTLDLSERSAASMANLVYKENPESYIKKTRSSMSAHLANMRPSADVEIRVGEANIIPESNLILTDKFKPKTAEKKDDFVKWSNTDAASQINNDKPPEEEKLEVKLTRLVNSAGIDRGRWRNKLLDALDDEMVVPAYKDLATALAAMVDS